MIPMGMVIVHTSDASFWTAIGVDPMQYADLDLYHFVVKNLIPVTLGNTVGGVFFIGLVQWFLYIRKH